MCLKFDFLVLDTKDIPSTSQIQVVTSHHSPKNWKGMNECSFVIGIFWKKNKF